MPLRKTAIAAAATMVLALGGAACGDNGDNGDTDATVPAETTGNETERPDMDVENGEMSDVEVKDNGY